MKSPETTSGSSVRGTKRPPVFEPTNSSFSTSMTDGGVFAAVDGGLDEVVEFLPLDDVERVGAAANRRVSGGEVVVVAEVLQAVDLDELALEVGEFAARAEQVDGVGEGDRRLHEHFGLLDEGRLERLDVVAGGGASRGRRCCR